MDPPDLRPFVARASTLVETAPPTSLAETRSWLVDPLLEALGWDVHADACRIDDTVAGVRLEYVLGVESTPALLVAVEPYPDALDAERARRLQNAMVRTGIDRALYTNGRRLALVAGIDDVDHLECALTAVVDHETELGHASRQAATRRLEAGADRLAARRLAVRRSRLAASVGDELAAVAGEEYEELCRAAADRLLEHLITSLSAASAPDDERTGLEHASSSTTGQHDPDAASATTDRDGSAEGDGSETEYVVRFFNDRGSIGAIGHPESDAAMAHAAAFLLERGLSGVRLPWQPDDGDGNVTVLNDEPVCADGSPMASYRELSNGLYLNTAGDDAERADRVLAMVERAGLRAMLTGGWSGETRSASNTTTS